MLATDNWMTTSAEKGNATRQACKKTVEHTTKPQNTEHVCVIIMEYGEPGSCQSCGPQNYPSWPRMPQRNRDLVQSHLGIGKQMWLLRTPSASRLVVSLLSTTKFHQASLCCRPCPACGAPLLALACGQFGKNLLLSEFYGLLPQRCFSVTCHLRWATVVCALAMSATSLSSTCAAARTVLVTYSPTAFGCKCPVHRDVKLDIGYSAQ